MIFINEYGSFQKRSFQFPIFINQIVPLVLHHIYFVLNLADERHVGPLLNTDEGKAPMEKRKTNLIDMDELAEIMDHDDELVRECFADFIQDSDAMLEKINQAIISQDAEQLLRAAHAIKGTLRYLAAHQTAEIALQLEKMGEAAQIDQAAEPFRSLHEECTQIRSFMREYQNK